jgi:hypothetical protein
LPYLEVRKEGKKGGRKEEREGEDERKEGFRRRGGFRRKGGIQMEERKK